MKITLILLLTCALSAHAFEYYVDQGHPSAGDSNAGTVTAPWATIGRAASGLTPGDVVYVKNGVYREEVRPLVSGAAGNVITYRAFPGHTPVVNGAEIITGWTQYAGTVYRAAVNWTPNNVFEDGVRMKVGVDPNSGYHHAESGTYLTLTDAELPDKPWVGAQVYFETDWPFTRTVTGWDAGTRTITWAESLDGYHAGIVVNGFNYRERADKAKEKA